MIFTRDFVTRENHWQITPLVTKKSLFTVTHALFFIYPLCHVHDVMHDFYDIFNICDLVSYFTACGIFVYNIGLQAKNS